MPLWELAKATGAAASSAIAYAPGRATNTVYHLHPAFNDVCIEVNPETQLHDVIPALQIELKRHRIDSRVFETGTPMDQCPVWLTYVAYVHWGVPPMSENFRSYMSTAQLTLRARDGTVLSSSAYELDPTFLRGRWASTRSKLEPVVTALVTGFEN
jgi:hypothetical protein